MDIVPKPCLLMLGRILCEGQDRVKGRSSFVIKQLRFPKPHKKPLTYFQLSL